MNSPEVTAAIDALREHRKDITQIVKLVRRGRYSVAENCLADLGRCLEHVRDILREAMAEQPVKPFRRCEFTKDGWSCTLPVGHSGPHNPPISATGGVYRDSDLPR